MDHISLGKMKTIVNNDGVKIFVNDQNKLFRIIKCAQQWQKMISCGWTNIGEAQMKQYRYLIIWQDDKTKESVDMDKFREEKFEAKLVKDIGGETRLKVTHNGYQSTSIPLNYREMEIVRELLARELATLIKRES